MRIAICQINVVIGAIAQNAAKIIEHIERLKDEKCDLVVFPELALCGYPPDDLILQSTFIEAQKKALEMIVSCCHGISVICGLARAEAPIGGGKPLRNSAVLIVDGKVVGYQDKLLLPTYDVFDERRFFEPGNEQRVWDIAGKKVGITICEDIWPLSGQYTKEKYFVNPLSYFEKKKIDLLINLSASPYSVSPTTTPISKIVIREGLVRNIAHRLECPVILCNAVGGQDDLIFDGSSVVANNDGMLMQRAKSFFEDVVHVDLSNKNTCKTHRESIESEIFSALTLGLRDYFHKQGFHKACIGLSGGIDSSLVACIATKALGSENVLGVLLPSRYTSQASTEDATLLACQLNIKTIELPIEGPFQAVTELMAPHFAGRPNDITEENLQSRIRGLLLMAISNKLGYLVLNTGNKSELAMGYFTLYGDACGAIGVIGDLLKRDVYAVSQWIHETFGWIPMRVFEKAPSAELRPNQKDSDSLPPYDLLDSVINEYIVKERSSYEIAEDLMLPIEQVFEIITKIHKAEYKRRQAPFALRVSEKAFSCGRKVPIVHSFL